MRAALISVLVLSACTPTSPSSTAVERRRDPLLVSRLQPLAPMRTARTLAGAALLNDGRVIVVGGFDGVGELASTEIYDPRSNEWAAGPSLAVPRARFALRNDTDLDLAVLGGESAGSPLASVEVLRNFASDFSDGGALQTPRADFTASEVARNVLLLAGGGLTSCETFDLQTGDGLARPAFASAMSSSAEAALAWGDVFMPSRGAWLVLPADGGAAEVLGAEPGLTSGFTTTMISDEQVVTVGGAQAWAYSPIDGGLFALPGLTDARTSHRASLMPSGELAVFGGWGAAGALGSGEVWNGSTWAPTPSGVARANHVQLVLPEGAVLIAGGDSDAGVLSSVALLERISPSATPVMTPTRAGACLAPLPDGRVLRVGGRPAGAEVFDPDTGRWTAVAPPSQARVACTASPLLDGRVLVVGGEDQNVPLASAEVYDSSADAWRAAGPLAVARTRHAAVTLSNGKVLVAGGFDATGAALASVELYEVGSNGFVVGAPMATARGAFPLVVLGDGDLLAPGGLDARTGARLTAVERYDWADDSWAPAAPLPIARGRHSATVLADGTVVVLGGDGAASASAHRYDPGDDAWTAVAGSAVRRDDAVLARLPFNRLLVAGDALVERIELSAGADVSLTLPSALPEVRGALLADGRVLVVGAASSVVFDEERGGPGAGPSLDPRPPLRSPSPPAVSGSGFHPLSTASDGTVLASPTNLPIVRFVHLATGHVRFAETEYFDDGSAMLNVPGGWVPGRYAVQVSVAGRLSSPQLTSVARACSGDADCGGGFCAGDQVCCATPCSTGDCLSGRCSVDPLDAGVPDDGGVWPDGGLDDAGVDAGAEPDAGPNGNDVATAEPPDAGTTPTQPRQLSVGFGCSTTQAAPALLMWVLVWRRRASPRRA